jgi:hypothetical protein
MNHEITLKFVQNTDESGKHTQRTPFSSTNTPLLAISELNVEYWGGWSFFPPFPRVDCDPESAIIAQTQSVVDVIGRSLKKGSHLVLQSAEIGTDEN